MPTRRKIQVRPVTPAQPLPPRTNPWSLNPAARLFLIFALYLALRWWFLGTMAPLHFSDTASYADQYRGGFAEGFFGRIRTWSYPFFIWLTGHRYGVVVFVQRLAGTLAWFALAWAAGSIFRSAAARRVAFWGTLLFSLTLFSLIWDVMLLSESFSNSCFIAMTAAWIWFLTSRSTGLRPLASFTALTIFFAGLRDSNAIYLIIIVLSTALALALRFFRCPASHQSRRAVWTAWGLAGVLLIACLVYLGDMRRCHRNWQSIGAVISILINVKNTDHGIIPNEENIAWLSEHYGIPVAEARARIGKTTYEQPPIPPVYVNWIKQRGIPALLGFMIHHPQWSLDTFNREFTYSDTEPGLLYLTPPEPWQRANITFPFYIQVTIHKTLDRILGFSWTNNLLFLITVALGAAWLVCAWRYGQSGLTPALGTLFFLFTCVTFMLFITIFGDWYEQQRHAITGFMALYETLPILGATVVERLAMRSKY